MAVTTAHADDLWKPAARLGQVALFWGVLQLAVVALDAQTKWDILPALRDSIGPELGEAVGLRAGLFLMILASMLIWAGMRPKKAPEPTLIERLKSQSEEEEKKEEKPPSLLHLTAVPVFLAIVCAGGFWGVERRYPHQHGAKAVNSSGVSAQPSLARRVLAADEPAAPPASDTKSSNKVRAYIVSLFAATPSSAEPESNASPEDSGGVGKQDHRAASISGRSARDSSAAAGNRGSSPCAQGANDGAAGSSGHSCGTSQGSGNQTGAWQFDPPNTSSR